MAEKNPIVTIEMNNGDVMKAELYPEVAPNTVNNFISLVNRGYYDGIIFHRVIRGFMIQGGDPEGTGIGGPGYSIKGEFTQNGFKNDLKHEPGVLSMARTMMPNSAGSQFFIMHQTSPHLDGQYAAFGKVIEGSKQNCRRGNRQNGQTIRTTGNEKSNSRNIWSRLSGTWKMLKNIIIEK